MAHPVLKSIELAIRRSFLRCLALLGSDRRQLAGTAALEAIERLGPSPSILLLRQDRIGDVLMSTFLMTALRERYPDSRIGILLSENNKAAAPLLPLDCEIFVYKKNIGDILKLRSEIRSRRFDIAIDLTDKASVTSSILLSLFQPKLSVGVQKENGVVYNITVPKFDQGSTHIAPRIAELLRPYGIDPKNVDLQPKLRLAVARVRGRVGLNVASRTPERSGPPAACAEIALGVLKMGFHEVVVFTAPHERERGAETVRLAGDSRIHLAPATSDFAQFAEQIASCEYFITVDTSTIQIAAAAGIPMLLLFRPMPDEHPWTPQGVPFEIHTQFPNLASLEPQPVLDLFSRLLDRTGRSIPMTTSVQLTTHAI